MVSDVEGLRHGSGVSGLWRRDGGVPGQAFEVLSGGGHEKLVPGAGKAPQSEPDHREDMLGLAKEPLDLLAFTGGRSVSLGLHQGTGRVAGLLVRVARDPARRRVGTASRLQWADLAIERAGEVAVGLVGMQPAGGLQGLAAGADIAVVRFVIVEVAPREGPILTFALVPDRDVRTDLAPDQTGRSGGRSGTA